jgi:LCP family protein required for cell wall assembly
MYGPNSPRVFAPPARYRRRSGGLPAFIQGGIIGFAGGGVVMSLLAILLLVFFPPRRTNILLLGLDRRPQETTYADRTDTMILITVYPQARYVGMLSIPRDLYVTVPGGFVDRINTAHFYAEAQQPGSGPGAAMATVRSNFGVDVNHFVRLDLAGFVRIIDAMGGINLNVPAPLVDTEYPTYDYGTETVVFDAGLQHMDGERALAYARIRHGSSDLQRAERQQLVIEAALERLLQPTAWPRLPFMALAVLQSVGTDLSLIDILRLAPTLLWVGPGNIDRAVIEGDMVQPFITDGGADVLLPVWANINPVLLKMFGQ